MKARDIVRLVLGIPVTAALVALVVWLAEFPSGKPAEGALLRLSWRITGQKAEICRRLSPEEIAARPLHMRKAEECAERQLDYALKVAVNGIDRVARIVQPAGVHGDRPVYVQEDLALAPGDYNVHVVFTPIEPQFAVTLAPPEREKIQAAMAKALRFDHARDYRIEAGQILLLTRDHETGELIARYPEPLPGA